MLPMTKISIKFCRDFIKNVWTDIFIFCIIKKIENYQSNEMTR